MLVPEIIEIYPGTSGSTQGERNDTRPAVNAAISETLCIRDLPSLHELLLPDFANTLFGGTRA
jgi:hypothetical protein